MKEEGSSMHIGIKIRSSERNSMDRHRYAAHPTTDVHCVLIHIAGREMIVWVPGDPVPPEVISYLAGGGMIHTWDAEFTHLIWALVLTARYGWPVVSLERFSCTMDWAKSQGLSESLQTAAKELGITPRRSFKDDRRLEMLAKRLVRNVKPHDRAFLIEQCSQDVHREVAICEGLAPLWSSDRGNRLLMKQINDRGILVERDLTQGALRTIAQAAAKRSNAGAIESKRKGGDLAQWLRQYPLDLAGANDRKLANIDVDELPDDFDELVRERDSAEYAIRNFEIMNCAAQDDVMRGRLVRESPTSRWVLNGPRLDRLARPPLDPAPYLDSIRNGEHESLDLVADPDEILACAVRSAIIARPGHRFVAGARPALVARVYAWIAGLDDLVEAFRQKQDVYRQTASDILDAPADMSWVQRQQGKIAFLALNQSFDTGLDSRLQRFIGTCDLGGVPFTIELYQKIRYTKLTPSPCIDSLDRELQDGAVRAVMERTQVLTPRNILFHATEKWLTMRLLSGRLLGYSRPRVQGSSYLFLERRFNHFGRDVRIDGRRLAEDLMHATVQDIMADAIARLQAAGYPVVLTVDHQIVTEPEIGFGSLEEVLEILRTPPSWATGLPLAAEGWEGPRYR
jgi:DNA polymerase